MLEDVTSIRLFQVVISFPRLTDNSISSNEPHRNSENARASGLRQPASLGERAVACLARWTSAARTRAVGVRQDWMPKTR